MRGSASTTIGLGQSKSQQGLIPVCKGKVSLGVIFREEESAMVDYSM